ncbi:hypothetical protein DEAC_c34670 [Desulfosporosinus acididurans]|uniref:Probable membrane transporter protein n=1 Tax=Desulfosporosinus acididurans TaxID=476652 RepID=A0A0J1IIH2_9FIRM|nr:hypothetical protein DEAC_c34670 [Desulfosporosinus acididurans]
MSTGLSVVVFAFSLFAGFLGSLLGLGGGIIIIPALTLALGVRIHEAIGASIVSVIATSSGAAIAYVRDKITNIRIGMFLETATTLGAITGAFIAGLISTRLLSIIFGLLLLYSAFTMFKKRYSDLPTNVKTHPLAERLHLNSEYYDNALHQNVKYQVTGIYPGYAVMYGAGVISGLLGIGSGVFKVLGMDVFMKLPMKVSTATSNFMIGVTAAASAGVYFSRGDIDPLVAGPVALGVLLGARIGTKVMERLKSKTLRFIFIPVLIYIALEMLWKAR